MTTTSAFAPQDRPTCSACSRTDQDVSNSDLTVPREPSSAAAAAAPTTAPFTIEPVLAPRRTWVWLITLEVALIGCRLVYSQFSSNKLGASIGGLQLTNNDFQLESVQSHYGFILAATVRVKGIVSLGAMTIFSPARDWDGSASWDCDLS